MSLIGSPMSWRPRSHGPHPNSHLAWILHKEWALMTMSTAIICPHSLYESSCHMALRGIVKSIVDGNDEVPILRVTLNPALCAFGSSDEVHIFPVHFQVSKSKHHLPCQSPACILDGRLLPQVWLDIDVLFLPFLHAMSLARTIPQSTWHHLMHIPSIVSKHFPACFYHGTRLLTVVAD
jgi:hypothetical protein